MAFNLWGTVGSIFNQGGATITTDHWDRANGINFGGDMLWIDSVTPSAGYNANNSLPYTFYIAASDAYGNQQDVVTLGTTTEIYPFRSSAPYTGGTTGAAEFSSSGGVITAGALYWVGGAVAGTYDLKFQGLTDTIANIPTATPAINLTGGAVTLEAGVSNFANWSYTYDATSLLMLYEQKPTSTTQNVFLQAFNTAGTATSPLTEVATGVSSGMAWSVVNDGTNFFYAHEDNTNATANIDIQAFNVTTGALGAALVLNTGLNDLTAIDAHFILGGSEFFGAIEGTTTGSNDLLRFGLFNATTGAQIGTGAQFTMSSTSTVHWKSFTIPGNEFALVYSDGGGVHMELLDSSGNQIGTDVLVGTSTGFDTARSLGDGRIEIVRRPGTLATTDPASYIYDTRTAALTFNGSAGDDVTAGTTFNDTFNGSGGNDYLNGGPGSDSASYANATSGVTAVVIGGNGTVVKSGIGTDHLTSIETIIGSAGTDVFTVDANEVVNGVSGFDFLIEASASVNLTYGTNFTNISEFVTNVGTNTIDASSDPNNILIYGSTGTDTLSLGTGGGYLFSGGGTGNVLNGGANATNIIIDSGGTSTMNGGTGTAANFFYVSGTNDTLHGAGAFNAAIYLTDNATYTTAGADGIQEVILHGGTNTVTGTGSTNFLYLYGAAGNDTLTTGSGGGYLIGGGGINTDTGGGGTNVFIADNASGIDHMFGGSSSNIYYIDANSDVHGAGAFNTVIELQSGVTLTLGSAQLGTDVQQVITNGGTNTINFGTATTSVYLYGGAGNDTINGGTGNDYLYGNAGANTFQFQTGWGNDVIGDWASGSGNIVDLTAVGGLGVHAVTDLTQTITTLNVNGNSVLSDVITSSHTGTNSITLWGVTAALGASAFHFA